METVQEEPKKFVDDAAEKAKRRERTIVLNNAQIWELNRLLGRNCNTVEDIIAAAKNVTTLKVKGIEKEITLEPYLLNRLRSRCPLAQDFPTFVRDRVLELIAGYCGA